MCMSGIGTLFSTLCIADIELCFTFEVCFNVKETKELYF